MKFNLLLTLTLIAILNISCEDDPPEVTQKSIQVYLKANELYEYDTKTEGDEEWASISSQASHFEISELIRDKSTNFSIVYKYQPELDFVGTDEVEIKLSTGSDGASPSTQVEFLKITFNISE